jgi:hypothetical protein
MRFQSVLLVLFLTAGGIARAEDHDTVIVVKKGDVRQDRESRERVLFQLLEALSPESKAVLHSIDWLPGKFSEAQERVPGELCEKVERLETGSYEEISRLLLQEKVAEKHWVCMAIAEFASLAADASNLQEVRWEDGRFVPVVVAIEDMNELYPVPRNPPCEQKGEDREPARSAERAVALDDPYRELYEWSATCKVDGRTVEYRYNHLHGWYVTEPRK